MMHGVRLVAATVGMSSMLAGCATNGEIGFAGHPLDCAVGVGHSDCAPGTPGFNRYAREGNTVFQDTLAIFGATQPVVNALSARRIGTSNAIESKIDGSYEGWTGETIYHLTNGQVWQQQDSLVRYHYAFSPAVLIYGGTGSAKMHVFGDVGRDAAVQRLN